MRFLVNLLKKTQVGLLWAGVLLFPLFLYLITPNGTVKIVNGIVAQFLLRPAQLRETFGGSGRIAIEDDTPTIANGQDATE